jgi:hypothetical protein
MSAESITERRVIQVSGPIFAQLAKLKAERKAELGRDVSYSEIIEEWRDVWAEVTK